MRVDIDEHRFQSRHGKEPLDRIPMTARVSRGFKKRFSFSVNKWLRNSPLSQSREIKITSVARSRELTEVSKIT